MTSNLHIDYNCLKCLIMIRTVLLKIMSQSRFNFLYTHLIHKHKHANKWRKRSSRVVLIRPLEENTTTQSLRNLNFIFQKRKQHGIVCNRPQWIKRLGYDSGHFIDLIFNVFQALRPHEHWDHLVCLTPLSWGSPQTSQTFTLSQKVYDFLVSLE